MGKAKILVATHRVAKVLSNEIYIPIHVGRALSGILEEMPYMQGDDTGENISRKNKEYCELTAVYWAWKNLLDVDYVGLVHYRRYFETEIKVESLDRLFNKYDVILPSPFSLNSPLNNKLSHILAMEDRVILLKVIKKLYPSYENSVIDYLYGFIDIPYNMFIMKTEFFKKYAKFLFTILFECEKHMRQLPYTCSMRRMGYIGEFLLPIFCFHEKLHIAFQPVVPYIGTKAKVGAIWKHKLLMPILHRIFDKYKPNCFEEMYDNAVIRGLEEDGIFV